MEDMTKLTQTSRPAPLPASGRTSWLTIGSFIVVTLLVSAVLLLAQSVFAVDQDLISLVMFAPTIAVILLIVVARRAVNRGAPAPVDRRRWLRGACIAVAVITAYGTILAVAATAFGVLRNDQPWGYAVPVVAFIALQILGGIGEEIGWRGFLQPALETRMSKLPAAIMVGVIWALWHVHYFGDLLIGAMFILNCIGLSILFAYLTVGSRLQRGILAGVLHALVNLALFFWFDPSSMLPLYIPFALIFTALCAAVVAMVRNRGQKTVMPATARNEGVTMIRESVGR